MAATRSPDPRDERALELAERIEGLGPVTVGRFFGGSGLKARGVQFGFVIEGTLYLRTDEAMRAALEPLGATPFVYDKRPRKVTVSTYFALPDECIDDARELSRWARLAWHAMSAHQASQSRVAPKPPRASRPAKTASSKRSAKSSNASTLRRSTKAPSKRR